MKVKCATIVHAGAVALRSEALPGAQDREQLAHFEFSLLEQFHGCGTALDDGVELGNQMHPCGQIRGLYTHVLEFHK